MRVVSTADGLEAVLAGVAVVVTTRLLDPEVRELLDLADVVELPAVHGATIWTQVPAGAAVLAQQPNRLGRIERRIPPTAVVMVREAGAPIPGMVDSPHLGAEATHEAGSFEQRTRWANVVGRRMGHIAGVRLRYRDVESPRIAVMTRRAPDSVASELGSGPISIDPVGSDLPEHAGGFVVRIGMSATAGDVRSWGDAFERITGRTEEADQ